MLAKVYGIPNCSSVKKALSSLKALEVDIVFHDFKKYGVSAQLLEEWLGQLEETQLLNRKGTTWRKLDEALRAKADSKEGARALMLEYPTLIKRPVVEMNGHLTVGQTEFQEA